jgi:hypothetical protein
MKKIPRNLVRVSVSRPENTTRGCANELENCRKWYGHSVEGKGRENRIGKKNGRHVPLLVTVNEPRRNRADVRACTDEQEDDEQEGLEIEKRRLRWSTSA